MARPNQSDARREALLPTIAEEFARLGYAGATTARLAEACALRENQLYRLWPSKKAMFLAVIEYLFVLETQAWQTHLDAKPIDQAFAEVLKHEGRHHGETGLHRILFAGLSAAAEDDEIHTALKDMYTRFHRFIERLLKEHRKTFGSAPVDAVADPSTAAWALIGLASVVNIGRELDLYPIGRQKKLMQDVGGWLAGLS